MFISKSSKFIGHFDWIERRALTHSFTLLSYIWRVCVFCAFIMHDCAFYSVKSIRVFVCECINILNCTHIYCVCVCVDGANEATFFLFSLIFVVVVVVSFYIYFEEWHARAITLMMATIANATPRINKTNIQYEKKMEEREREKIEKNQKSNIEYALYLRTIHNITLLSQSDVRNCKRELNKTTWRKKKSNTHTERGRELKEEWVSNHIQTNITHKYI